MREAIKQLSKAQKKFICEELEMTEEKLNDIADRDDAGTGEEKALELYDKMCNIELEELPTSDDEDESERCSMASDIVTILGNAIAEENGYMDDEE